MDRIREYLGRGLRHEAAPGLLLMMAMLAALVAANSGLSWYDALLDTEAMVGLGNWELRKPLLLWINDGMMTLFFLVVGLELKREIRFGALSDRKKLALPLFAALGGMMVPITIYVAINWEDPINITGWAIPAATDVAFALGVLALLGSRVPPALKILLASVAIIDDIGAIIIIAVFYSGDISLFAHGCATVLTGILFILNRKQVNSSIPFVLVGLVLWFAVLKSGIHATLAGIVIAVFIPEGTRETHEASLAHRAETRLHPWVQFGILPLFAFANSGLSLKGLHAGLLLEPVPLGIALGLFVGKPCGILAAAWLAVRCGWARLPSGISWGQVCSLAVLCGIGFTMSLFIGSLAFELHYIVRVRVGILAGSLAAGLAGAALLWWSCPVRSGQDLPAKN